MLAGTTACAIRHERMCMCASKEASDQVFVIPREVEPSGALNEHAPVNAEVCNCAALLLLARGSLEYASNCSAI